MNEDIKKELASCMVSPIRCGGLSYYEGKGYYKFGEHFMPADIIREQRDEWFTAGGHDHKICQMLWTKLVRPRPVKTNKKNKCDHNWVMDGHNAGDPICSKCYSRE